MLNLTDGPHLKKVVNGGGPKADDALSGELWEVKRERIRKASVHGKLPGWDLRSVSSGVINSAIPLFSFSVWFVKQACFWRINVCVLV